ncbi:MAG: respiratory nitrate reductase subunit gamma [Pirellulales bacterium]|nr:respiratory nitrate reductase subunit gamma [Pirellulales bacterium]
MSWFFTGPFLYAAALLFLAGTAYKIISISRMPRHLRWELYPLPRLGAAGSRYQQVDHGRSPREISRLAEIGVMAEEILLLKKLFANRRDLWFGSYLLHVGLYFSIAGFGLVLTEAVLVSAGLAAAPASGSLAARVLGEVVIVAGIGGSAAGLFGAAFLLARRLTDPGLRDMSDPVTFFNLAFLVVLFASGLLAWTADGPLEQVRTHMASLLRGRPGVVPSTSLALAMTLSGLFAAYLPFSRMFHFAAKYFFYHRILWDDEPMHGGTAIQRDFAGYLRYPLTWSGEHLQPRKAWSEQLSSRDDAHQG